MKTTMKLKKYSKYKNSWIDWIWEIPEEWSEEKLKLYFNFKKWKNSQFYSWEYVNDPINTWRYPVYSWQTENNWVMWNINTYLYDYKDKDVMLVTTVWAKAMTIFKINWRFTLSQNCALIDLKSNNLDTNYYYYYCQRLFEYERELIPDIMQPSLRIEDLREYNIVLPSIQAQQKISYFLDSKTVQIEKLIEKDKNLIELLKEKRVSLINQAVTKWIEKNVKMKDSWIEWIWEIPESWDVRKLKTLVSKKAQYGAWCEPSKDKEEIIYIRITDIWDNWYLRDTERVYLSKEDARQYYLYRWDVLFARSWATVWKTYSHTLENNKDYCYAGYLIRYRADNKNLIWKYLFYFTLSKSYTEWIKSVSIQATIENVSADKYNELFLAIWTIKEQQQIVEFLDKETVKIDNHIKKVEKRIELYEEYKKSLIYNVVTGKVEV